MGRVALLVSVSQDCELLYNKRVCYEADCTWYIYITHFIQAALLNAEVEVVFVVAVKGFEKRQREGLEYMDGPRTV